MTYRIPGPDDRLRGDAVLPAETRVVDFWRWAYSDLCEDYLHGIFAEWMVGVLLGLPMTASRRLEFARCDHKLRNGSRLEVKATACWQSWKLLAENGSPRPTHKKPPTPESKIRFSGLKAQRVAGETHSEIGATYNADVYVFCFHNESDPDRWDALDLSQWEFYVLPRNEMEQLGTKTIALGKLRCLTERLTAKQLQDKMRAEYSTPAA